MQAILVFALLVPSFLQQQLPDATVILKQQPAAAEKYRTLQYVAESSMEMLPGPVGVSYRKNLGGSSAGA
jgi:hypothetical protein